MPTSLARMSDTQAGEFLGDMAGFLAWAAGHWKGNIWCPRHWAPCPVEGRNGLVASLLVTQELQREAPSNLNSAAAINRWAEKHSPVCCYLGDERMSAIWEQAT